MAEYRSPYTERILKETLALREAENAPAAPMFSEEELSRRRAQQYYDEQLAVALKMSGQKGLESLGAAMLPEAVKARSTKYVEHGEYDPPSGTLKQFPEVQRQRELTRRQREIDVLEQREATDIATNQQARQREVERRERDQLPTPYKKAAEEHMRAKTAALQSAQKEGKPLTGAQLKIVKDIGNDLDNIDFVAKEVKTKYNTNSEGTGVSRVEALKDWAVREAPIIGAIKPEWKANQEAVAALQRIIEMKARHTNFGATLSGNEKAAWEQVTPPRGLSRKELSDWVDMQKGLIERAASHTAELLAAGGANKRQLEIGTRGRWKAPTAEEAMSKVPPPSVGGQAFDYDPATGEIRYARP